ncbi:hypothetical protein OH76DRAFT_1082478 [Lentinus brumalis]|uniref:Protein kinase domain-containing protein n=1 Tax=Lentinus brumalis TaxID=2498619 RepID=A0A371DP43_9APHY|nr:hypothetical protein OH76DRAFT_1082478 [Polyporus brumalis]
MFSAGQNISLTTNGRTLTFSIERPFTPFTKSVVLLASSTELGPDPVVIKIYDPRFLDERVSVVESQPSRPWSLAAEQAAAALPSGAFDEDKLWEDEPDEAEGRAERAALWEEHFRRLSAECYASERSAYEHLRVYQGSTIPRLLLAGVLLPPDKRAIQPSAVVLEYIPDAVSLRDVPGDALDVNMCLALIRAVDGFSAHGVFHGDINHNNILFTPQERPFRAVVIDFGCAGIKADDEDEETWQFNVQFAADSKRIRRLLEDKGVRVQDHAAAAA